MSLPFYPPPSNRYKGTCGTNMPVFSPSYAEMDKAEKNKISHRSKALAKLQAWFAKEMAP